MSDFAVRDRLIAAGMDNESAEAIVTELATKRDIEALNRTIQDLERKIQDLERKIDKNAEDLERKIDKNTEDLERKIDKLADTVKDNSKAIGGLKTTLIIGLCGIIAAITASPFLSRLLS